MKTEWKEYKLHLFLAIIAALLVPYFFEPAVALLGSLLIKVGNGIASSVLDRLYQEAAQNRGDWGYLIALIAVIVYPLVYFVRRERRFAIILWVGLLLAFTVAYVEIKTVTLFYQRLEIVAPHINEQERAIIVANFRSMNGYQDYKKILLHIDSIARSNQIALPKNSLYPF